MINNIIVNMDEEDPTHNLHRNRIAYYIHVPIECRR